MLIELSRYYVVLFLYDDDVLYGSLTVVVLMCYTCELYGLIGVDLWILKQCGLVLITLYIISLTCYNLNMLVL